MTKIFNQGSNDLFVRNFQLFWAGMWDDIWQTHNIIAPEWQDAKYTYVLKFINNEPVEVMIRLYEKDEFTSLNQY